MSVWADAFDAAYAVEPLDFTSLASLLSARVGQTVDADWVAASIDEVMAHVLLQAPCKDDEWTDPTVMPAPVQAVVASVLCRLAANPQGVRTIQMGEFSQTYAGSVTGSGDMLTSLERRIVARQSGCGSSGIVSIEVEPTAVLDLSSRTI